MIATLGSFQLSTQERRIVVVTGTILFMLLNFWLVWPRFKDWKKAQTAIAASRQTLQAYQTELAKTNDYQVRLKKLENAGSQVPTPDQANTLIATVQLQATRSKLATAGIRPLGRAGSNVATNRFFEEQTIEVGISPTDDKDLIDFLVAMGTGDSMIRVKDMQLRPDNTQMKLQGKIQLVASFQKQPPSPTSTQTNSPAVAPAAGGGRSFSRARSDPAGSVTNALRAQPPATKP